MNGKLRLVQDEKVEEQIFQKKLKEATQHFDFLLIQVLCFGKYPEYFSLMRNYLDYIRSKDVDKFLRVVNSFKYLYALGTPNSETLERVKSNFKYVSSNAQGYKATNNEEMKIWRLINRYMIRAIILNKTNQFTELSKILEQIKNHSYQMDDLKLTMALIIKEL